MRDEDMARIAAIDRDAEMARRRAQVLLARAGTPRMRRSRSRDRPRPCGPVDRCASGPAASITPAISWPSVKGSVRPAVMSSFLSAASLK